MYAGKPGSTGVVTSLTDEHASAFSPQTVRRISDLRAKWIAPNQTLLAKARQLVDDGEGNDRHAEFLPMELYEPGDPEAESEPAGNVYQLQVENIALVCNGFGIGDSGQPGKMFRKCPAGPLSVHSGSGTSDPIGGAKPARLAHAVRPTQQPDIFNSKFFCNLVRWFCSFCVPHGDAAVPPERVASVSGPTSHTIKDVS